MSLSDYKPLFEDLSEFERRLPRVPTPDVAIKQLDVCKPYVHIVRKESLHPSKDPLQIIGDQMKLHVRRHVYACKSVLEDIEDEINFYKEDTSKLHSQQAVDEDGRCYPYGREAAFHRNSLEFNRKSIDRLQELRIIVKQRKRSIENRYGYYF